MSKGISKDNFILIWSNLKLLLAGKVDKVEGKGLSTNDFSNEAMTKLNGIQEGATKTIVDTALNTQSTNPVQNKVVAEKLNEIVTQGGEPNTIETVKVNGQELTPDSAKAVDVIVPTKVSQLSNDSGFLTAVPSEYVTETELTEKGYQTALQVDTLVSGKGYQTQDQVNTLITQKGYITSGQVDTKLANYATKEDVAGGVTYKGQVANVDALPDDAEIGDMYDVQDTGCNYIWNGTSWDDTGGTMKVEYCTAEEIEEIMEA